MLSALVQRTIEKRRMFGLRERVLVGVSGGADSVCLLLVLGELGYDVSAAHLNHGLRGAESDGDEAFVKELCDRLALPFHSGRTDIMKSAGNLEAEGRRARKRFFNDLVREFGFDRIALAHNQNDRVETFLLNLMRGAGLDGLTSTEPVSGNVVRPLIEVSRSAIESYLTEKSQTWRTDATNMNLRFARNRIRHDVIPKLSESFNPQLRVTLARTIDILADENAFIEKWADDWLTRNGTKRDDDFVIQASELMSVPVAVQRRILRQAVAMVSRQETVLRDTGFEHIEAARSLLRPEKSGKWIELPGGFKVVRSFDQLIVRNRTETAVEFDYELQIPGEIHIPELRRKFTARIVTEAAPSHSPDRAFVDGSLLGPYVRIRNWKPGDYYWPVGLPAGKLKRLFQRARIPRNERHRLPVFVADSMIVWVASFPVSREFASRGCSQRIVAFEALPA